MREQIIDNAAQRNNYRFNNALGEWIIPHEATECSIENFEFIVSERVQVNPDNSWATSALTFLLFKLNSTLHKETLPWNNYMILGTDKPWCKNSGVLNLHHGYYTTIMTSRRLFCHNSVSRGTNQPIRKSEFVQCMKFE